MEKSQPCLSYLSKLKNSLKDKVQKDFLDFKPITVIETNKYLKGYTLIKLINRFRRHRTWSFKIE